jgi:uncharacterized protein YbjT (DUF2867 family)
MTRHKQIAVQDIGAFAARVFAEPEEWIGRAVDLAGDALTMEETAATMSRVLRREVRYVQVPWDQFEAEPHTLERYLHAAGWGGA